MANAARGEIEIKLGETTRIWRLTMADMAALEAHIQSIRGERVQFHRFISEAGSWTTEDYMLVIWYGLRKSCPDLKDVQSIGDLGSMDVILDFQMKFAEWMNSMMPESLQKKLAAQVQQNKDAQG